MAHDFYNDINGPSSPSRADARAVPEGLVHGRALRVGDGRGASVWDAGADGTAEGSWDGGADGTGDAEQGGTGDRHAAEDAVQAALVRTYAAWPRVRRDDAFAYARRILVNYVTDKWRRRLREYATGDLPEPAAAPDAAAADIADQVALRQWLIGALGTLTVRERAVIVMRYLFDLPEATVGTGLGEPQPLSWRLAPRGAPDRIAAARSGLLVLPDIPFWSAEEIGYPLSEAALGKAGSAAGGAGGRPPKLEA